tara:strand:+ start:227 stop:385 length:159 start_codon:yes stop_codon:yes gene_type:complete
MRMVGLCFALTALAMAGLHLGVATVMGRGRNMANFLGASLIFAMIYMGLIVL